MFKFICYSDIFVYSRNDIGMYNILHNFVLMFFDVMKLYYLMWIETLFRCPGKEYISVRS